MCALTNFTLYFLVILFYFTKDTETDMQQKSLDQIMKPLISFNLRLC